MVRPYVYLARIWGGILVVLLCGSVAFSQTGAIIKSPPSKASDIVSFPLTTHIGTPPTWGGWAGVRVKIHILDESEIDGGNFMPAPMTPTPPFVNTLPASSIPTFRTILDPSWPNSGRVVQPSQQLPAGTVKFHVAGSNGQNSDVDATAMIWNIYHVRGGLPGSTIITVPGSGYIRMPPTFPSEINPTNPPFEHIVGQPGTPLASAYVLPPSNPTTAEQGHWAHVLEPIRFHIPPGHPGSNLIAFMAGTVQIGIDHVPEPTAAVLAVGGMASLLVGMALRLRRNRAAWRCCSV
jgi:hypothetical protein